MNRQTRYLRFTHVLLAGLALVTPGCLIGSDSPVSDPDKAKADESLVGTWETTVIQPDAAHKGLTVEKLVLPGYPPGLMKATLNATKPDNTPKSLVFFVSDLNGQKFANLVSEDIKDPRHLPAWDKLKAKGYGIQKYDVSGDTLKLWLERQTVLEKAIMAGKLKGKWAGGPYYSYIQLTDTSDNLARFLASEDSKELFVKGSELKRVK